MQRQGIDALIVSPSSDLVYLTGHPSHLSERLTAFVVPAKGDPLLVSPKLEAPLARDVAALFALHTWADGDDAYGLLCSLLPAAARRIAVSDQMWSAHLLRLQEALPGVAFSAASRLLAPMRRVKDAAEIASLKRAAAAADAVMAEILATPLLGQTERAIGRMIADLLIAHGHTSADFTIVASGGNSGSPHHAAGERVLHTGDALTLDFGGVFERYYSDITRSVFAGAPPAEYRRIYETVRQAQQAAFETVRPGAACQDIDRAARRVIAAAGYGEYFIHRTGHGLGLDVHEEPYMVEGAAMPLEPGMVFSIEPGVYIPNRYGVRIEDIVVVTETGGERLNHAPRALREIG
jgi:D-alanyl-D-alanine dipeptidase